jgi:cyanate lyase
LKQAPLRSFPHTRESSPFTGKNWVPAFAGTNGDTETANSLWLGGVDWHDPCDSAKIRKEGIREAAMTRAELTDRILDIKRENGWTWKHICEQIGGMSPVLITGALLGQMKLTRPQAAAAAKLFGLSKVEQSMLNEVPMRGTGTPMPPTDPLIYRFYELVMVNGPALKALIEEEFGDGIMSAIDFDMVIERQPDPKGDRVKIGMTGKFLPYKYYGATGNALTYGLKEE